MNSRKSLIRCYCWEIIICWVFLVIFLFFYCSVHCLSFEKREKKFVFVILFRWKGNCGQKKINKRVEICYCFYHFCLCFLFFSFSFVIINSWRWHFSFVVILSSEKLPFFVLFRYLFCWLLCVKFFKFVLFQIGCYRRLVIRLRDEKRHFYVKIVFKLLHNPSDPPVPDK